MAGHARYTALLDACVLFPVVSRDALLSLAASGLFAAKWSERIEREWTRALERRRPDLVGKLQGAIEMMRAAIPDWEVPENAVARIEPCLVLPDPNDAHVLAAAIAGHVDCIVTTNLKDFPAEILTPMGIEAIHPDQFMIAQWDLDPYPSIAALKGMRARWRRPEATPEDFVQAFDRSGLPAMAQRLREAAGLI